MNSEEQYRESDERADQWSAGGTIPTADDVWSIPAMPLDDPDATVPLRPRTEPGDRRIG
jgi:hypothetical protein